MKKKDYLKKEATDRLYSAKFKERQDIYVRGFFSNDHRIPEPIFRMFHWEYRIQTSYRSH